MPYLIETELKNVMQQKYIDFHHHRSDNSNNVMVALHS